MADRGIDGLSVGLVAAGGLIAYAGIKGVSIPSEVQKIIQGQSPAGASKANPITSVTSSSSASATTGNTVAPTGHIPVSGGLASASDAANAALGKILAANYGWATGQNWQALNYGWGTLESGWDSTIFNEQGSGAFGIAQALGHGTSSTAGTLTNEYGPIGGMTFANSLYVGANSGNAADQIRWGLKYIQLTYGSPSQVPGWLGQGGYGGY